MAVTLTRDRGTFVIRDEGPGFDPLRVPDLSDTSALEKAGGAAVILMRLFMDEMIFDETGREVTLTRSRKRHPAESPPPRASPKCLTGEMPEGSAENNCRLFAPRSDRRFRGAKGDPFDTY